MRRTLSRLAFAVLLASASAPAHAALLSGFLADCLAISGGVCAEPTSAGYGRQPISFGNLKPDGASASSLAYSFAPTFPVALAGHALYDAPTGGNLMLLLPFATPFTPSWVGDRGDVGSIVITVTGATGNTADSYNATWPAATVIGTMADGSPVSTGVAVTILKGQGSSISQVGTAGPAGAAGPRGAMGPTGPAGPPGPAGTMPVTTLTSGITQAIAFPATGSAAYDVTMTDDTVFTLTGGNPAEYQTVVLILRQGASGGWLPSLPSGVIWPGGVTPTVNTLAGKIDLFILSTPDGGATVFGNY